MRKKKIVSLDGKNVFIDLIFYNIFYYINNNTVKCELILKCSKFILIKY